MVSPLFSVVIPAYNQAEFLPMTIQSVLDQTLPDFEIVIVNDASPDNTTEVVQQIKDPRIRLIIHEENKRLPATRNTGMRSARGKFIALLDADDLFHPDKLKIHSEYLFKNPEIDVTYNARFELNYSDTTIRELVRPPLSVGLTDLIFGYPFTPSDMVIRKNVIQNVGYFDECYVAGGEDMQYPAKLALAGCQFASVDRALNYRRHHSGRYRKNIIERVNDVQNALASIYADPRCPEDVRQLGETPLSEHYMSLIYHAFIQGRTNEGQRFLHKLVMVNPNVLQGSPCPVAEYFTNNSTADEKDDHTEILKRLFAQLPLLPVDITNQLNWTIQQGFLIKGVRATLWERPAEAEQYFREADQLGAKFSQKYLHKVSQHIINLEFEMGDTATDRAMEILLPNIRQLCPPKRYRWFLGQLSAKRAFENYRRLQYNRVPANVIQALINNPRQITNRGILSIFARSLLQR
jgi:glycosyltransferase involved in cell wall biosynthesis